MQGQQSLKQDAKNFCTQPPAPSRPPRPPTPTPFSTSLLKNSTLRSPLCSLIIPNTAWPGTKALSFAMLYPLHVL